MTAAPITDIWGILIQPGDLRWVYPPDTPRLPHPCVVQAVVVAEGGIFISIHVFSGKKKFLQPRIYIPAGTKNTITKDTYYRKSILVYPYDLGQCCDTVEDGDYYNY